MPTILNNTARKGLTTLARAKTWFGPFSDTYDGMLIMAINHATRMIEQHTGRNLLSQSHTEYLDGKGTAELTLKNYPVTAVASFSYRAANDNVDSWYAYDADDEYRWYEDGRVQNLIGKFSDVGKKYRAIYTAGYKVDFDNENDISLHTLPEDLEYVCLKLVSAMFNTRRSEGFSSTSQGDMSVTMKGVMMKDPEVKELLAKYKRYVF
jgi:uncharacterized phiE125 gp8 family phage protein